ncbi:MAG TPA: SPOR domain-containing protein [Thermoanaerobaculaceae bacterium]|nr:SPOR domain-containing protein [Thermoanaerobaculaceae bacterium]
MSSGKPKVVPVSELFDGLVTEFRSANVPHSVLFQTALRVCAEDSKRVQRGEPPSQIRALVRRARTMLETSHPAAVPPPGGWMAQASPGDLGLAEPLAPPSAPEPAPPAPEPPEEEPPLPEFEPVLEPSPPPSGLGGPSAPEPVDTAPPPPPSEVPPATGFPPPERVAEPISPVLKLQQPGVSFQDLFSEGGSAEDAPAPAERREVSSLLFGIGVVAVALLAGAVVIVILWPGIAPRKQVPSRIVESYPAPLPTATQPVPAAAPVAATEPPPARATAAVPTPLPVRATEPPAPVQPVRAPRGQEVEGVETMRSADWAGRAPTFVVHFASYRSKENAVADAARLTRELGRPAHALVVDLGDKGTWYRVVVGDFGTVEEARAFRADALARKTGELGGIYRLAAP